MLAQDHDGLLELNEVEVSKAVAISSRAAMDPAEERGYWCEMLSALDR